MKNMLLAGMSALITVVVVLLVIRYFAPGLLGLPVDLRLVAVSEKLPPFYESVIRAEDVSSQKILLSDPYTIHRNKPFMTEVGNLGPTDIMGFRNRQVPNVADVITIGDSQTFGNNALLEDNWPSWMMQNIDGRYVHYSMATGGWGAVQYLNMFNNALVFKPRVIVIAFYSGNDAIDSFKLAYGVSIWNELIPDNTLTSDDLPEIVFPAPREEQWKVRFSDGLETILSPGLRLAVNTDHPAVNAGYKIMADVARRISQTAKASKVKVIFTIIPTKELVYAKKIQKEGIQAPSNYLDLVSRESRRISDLSDQIKRLEAVEYVDITQLLQDAAMGSRPIYPAGVNGHPVSYGYRLIGEYLAPKVASQLPALPVGQIAIKSETGDYLPYFITGDTALLFGTDRVFNGNGWRDKTFKPISARDAAIYRKKIVDDVNRDRYGPKALMR